MRRILLVCCLSLACGGAYGQTADGPSFDVVSIKPAVSPTAGGTPLRVRVGCTGGPGTTDPGLVNCSFVSLADMIVSAYGLERYQFTPADWMVTGRFDITAKIPAGTTREQFLLMQQRMLAERFKLVLHHEQKEMALYELTVGKSGVKLKESAPDAASQPEEPGVMPKFSMGKDGFPSFPPGRTGMIGLNGHFRWTAVNVFLPDIVKTISNQLGRPVVDATGLKGKYDVDLYWAQESMGRGGLATAAPEGALPAAEIDSGPTILSAVQNQLGLKLESKKGPVDMVVVDHAEKVPSEN